MAQKRAHGIVSDTRCLQTRTNGDMVEAWLNHNQNDFDNGFVVAKVPKYMVDDTKTLGEWFALVQEFVVEVIQAMPSCIGKPGIGATEEEAAANCRKGHN